MRLIDELQHVVNVRDVIQWVPSHIGIHGNKTVDSLAKKSSARTQLQNLMTCAQVLKSLRCKLVTLWTATLSFNDEARCH
ncbi:hypothetical protein PoB_007504600 [Plakobranchus ocellatus]|uniref:RNase H type-1 domain-containing protein n=1 Tax=Plakobranchus ocellatus TaxID=259542 RepID=A0AAV4DXI3_9GAST|nr:hypothetical protein PoB_007504600 [Plakobranchus ocellatus]